MREAGMEHGRSVFRFRKPRALACGVLFFIAVIAVFFYAAPSMSVEWQEAKGEHFIVNFIQDANFAKDVLNNAEIYYNRIASELGYPRYSEFWTWDKRVRIYIYSDHATFLKVTGQPEWSQGMADYSNKSITSFAWSKGFVEFLLPHEIAHLIFRDFVGFKGQVPLWLDEGVAQWAEEQKRDNCRKVIKKLYDEDTLLSFDDMMKLDISMVKDTSKAYIRPTTSKTGEKITIVLAGQNFVDAYYLESVSMIDFLIEKYGSNSFSNFCRELRDGKSIEEALKFAYPVQIRNLGEFESKWREYISTL